MTVKRVAFVDETVQHVGRRIDPDSYYQLTAVLIDITEVVALRSELRSQMHPRTDFKASSLAANEEFDTVVELLEFVAQADCWNVLVARAEHGLRQEEARQRCLRELLLEFESQGVRSVVLDSRQDILGDDPEVRNDQDRLTVSALKRSRDLDRNFTVQHAHDAVEPLLWIPDAVGWSYRRSVRNADDEAWQIVEAITTVIDPQAP